MDYVKKKFAKKTINRLRILNNKEQITMLRKFLSLCILIIVSCFLIEASETSKKEKVKFQAEFQDPSLWNGKKLPKSQKCTFSEECKTPAISLKNVPEDTEAFIIEYWYTLKRGDNEPFYTIGFNINDKASEIVIPSMGEKSPLPEGFFYMTDKYNLCWKKAEEIENLGPCHTIENYKIIIKPIKYTDKEKNKYKVLSNYILPIGVNSK